MRLHNLKSIRYSGDFVIAGFVIAGLTVIPGGLSSVRYNGVFVIAGFLIVGCHCRNAVV